jgi:putative oxidoreductase
MSMATGASGYHAGERETVSAVTANDIGLFVLRVILGVIFFAHGGQKVMGWFGGPGLDQTVQGFSAMGIPAPLAYLAAFTELLGGLAMILGVFSRIAAVGLAITMVVAAVMVHLPNGFFMGPKPGIEYTLALFAMSVAILFTGPGRLALSDWEGRLLGARR